MSAPASLDEKRARARVLMQQQQFADARELYRQICTDDAGDTESWFMLGAVSAQLGRLDEAADCCVRVISLEPRHARALFNLAQIRMSQGQFVDAVKLYRKVLNIEPGNANVRAALQQAEAMAAGAGRPPAGAATGKRKGGPRQLYRQGQDFQQQGNWEAALDCYAAALAKDIDSLPLLNACGLACQMLGRYDQAAAYYEQALAIDSQAVEARYNLGIAYKELLRLPEAAACYQAVLRAQPEHAHASHGLGIVKIMQGEAGEAEEILRAAIERDPNNSALRSCRLLAQNYYRSPPQELLQAHRDWDRHFAPAGGKPRPAATPADGRRLRVGYVSPDFCNHPVAYFIAPLLAQHDRSAFEVYCYANVARPDGITGYFRSIVDHWRDINTLSDAALQKQIRADRIDILVDLAGHTAGSRLGAFAHAPAPLQVSYLGYPNTTGLAAMDYRLTDAWADPPGTSDAMHSETLLRLPHGFLCYKPMEGTEVSPLPALEHGYITFGSFNNLAKITAEVVAVWARLLQAVAGSRLLVKTRPLQDASTRDALYRRFADLGIDPARVELVGWLDKLGDHLGLYGRVDIGLDTFPYNGTTTTCEALWMGVPVITLAGDRHAGRVGVSLLSQVGLEEMIAGNEDEYVSLASRLAGDGERLEGLRAGLRQRVAASSLCDAGGFAREVEAVYREIWERACAQQAQG